MGILIIVSKQKPLCNWVVISYNPSTKNTNQLVLGISTKYADISSSFQVTGPVIRQGPETASVFFKGPIFFVLGENTDIHFDVEVSLMVKTWM